MIRQMNHYLLFLDLQPMGILIRLEDYVQFPLYLLHYPSYKFFILEISIEVFGYKNFLFFPYSDSDENELDMILAEAREEVDSEEYIDTDDDEYDSYDSDEALDDVPSLEGGFSNFSDEETKSKFTQYSMSSSVIRRNEQLSTLDDQFEKFFVDQYDENDMGSLGTI